MNRFKKGIMNQARCGVSFPNLKAEVMIDSGSLPQYIVPVSTAKYKYGLTDKKDIFPLFPFFFVCGRFQVFSFPIRKS